MTTNLLILGNGPCAAELVRQLAGEASSIVVAHGDAQWSGSGDLPALPDDQTGLEIISEAQVISVQGVPGSYQVDFRVDQALVSIQTERIVLADEPRIMPTFARYGLAPSAAVLALSDVDHVLIHAKDAGLGPLDNVHRAAFITGLAEEGHPWNLERVMRSAMTMQTELGIQVYLMTGNLKVAGDGLEAMYRHCKQAGIVMLKFTSQMPLISQTESGHARFQFTDEVTGHLFQLSPDVTIVDEITLPSAFTAAAVAQIRLLPDRDGFAQSDNVHRLTVLTNRRGIYAAGPARAAWGAAEYTRESACAAMAVAPPLPSTENTGVAVAQIDKGRCIRCLTCLRVCHYSAIVLDPRPEVVPDLCERCGACAAECPRKAVAIEDLLSDRLLRGLTSEAAVAAPVQFAPSLVAFCCSRSAVQARDLALCMSKKMPPNLKVVEVPCGGGISVDHVLECLKTIADGVILFTCHDGNCHSEKGSTYAQCRVAYMRTLFPAIGLETERVKVTTIASNMGTAFADEVNRFAQNIGQMGSNPLLKSAG